MSEKQLSEELQEWDTEYPRDHPGSLHYCVKGGLKGLISATQALERRVAELEAQIAELTKTDEVFYRIKEGTLADVNLCETPESYIETVNSIFQEYEEQVKKAEAENHLLREETWNPTRIESLVAENKRLKRPSSHIIELALASENALLKGQISKAEAENRRLKTDVEIYYAEMARNYNDLVDVRAQNKAAKEWYDERIYDFLAGEYHKDYIIVTAGTIDNLAKILLKKEALGEAAKQ